MKSKIEHQKASHETQDLFALAFQATPHPHVIITLKEGRMLEVNDAFLQITGYARGELLGESVAARLWRSPAARREAARRLRAGDAVTHQQAALYTKSGEALPMWFAAVPVEFRGARCGLITTSGFAESRRDEAPADGLLAREKAARLEAEHISQLYARLFEREQQARAEAEAAHREWQTTFDAMADQVMLIDCEDRLVRANRAFYEAHGLTPEQVIGRLFSSVIHDAEKTIAAADCPVCNLRQKAERAFLELPAGIITAYPVAISLDPISDDAGNRLGLVQVVRDLTELYRAREEAERERASLNTTIEQMAEGLMIFDAQATLIRANRRARAMFGLPDDASHAATHYAPPDQFTEDHGIKIAPDKLPVQTALREQRVVEARLWYMRQDDQRVFLAINASPLFNEQNQLVGAIALLRDVTEQQREQERAQQADKLRALGQLSSGVAHNFNNALAAVLGYTQLCIPKVKGTEVEKHLRVVEQSAKDAARMVERIQNFARARARTDNFLPLCVSDIVQDAFDITRPRWQHDAEARGVKYDVRLDWQADDAIMVNGEPSELREVFVNLILNALDAMPKGGRLEVRATADDRHLWLSFVDNGSGMSEETKRRIFEPFFTTKGVLGLGMGLSETYRIIERHGGRIDVESQPHRGTVFTLLLPVAQLPKYDEAGDLVDTAVHGVDVLVIDDEEPVGNVLAALLTDLGHRVTVVASAEEGLRLIERHPFDIVFTDLAMPKQDGIAAAAAIKACRPQTRIVLMSGYGAERASERAAETDCIDATLSKPFRVFEIQSALRTLLPEPRS
ncbi:MAG TPA: PAS domain S-box protein [Blastocatellia bacterium]|nr:PAS domain S-box protein [Blastocatellia bacterium]